MDAHGFVARAAGVRGDWGIGVAFNSIMMNLLAWRCLGFRPVGVGGIPFMKGYTVFNVEQVDGLPAHFYGKAEAPRPVERLPAAEAFFLCTGANVQHGGNRAFYAPSRDLIQMPPRRDWHAHDSMPG